MKFNDFFNMKRFGLLVKHDLMINQNKYLLKMLVLFLGLYAIMVLLMFDGPQQFIHRQTAPQGYIMIFVFSLIALGVFIGGSFSDLGSKVKRTSFILLPASTFEKMLHPFLLRVVLGIVCYLLFFWVDAQLARLTMANAPSILIQGLVIEPFHYSQIIDGMGRDDFAMIVFLLFSFGMYLFTMPLFFKKQALLKAIFVFFIALFTYICFFSLMSHLFHPGNNDGLGFTIPDFKVYKELTSFDLLFDSIAGLSWMFFLVFGYFKLKELKL